MKRVLPALVLAALGILFIAWLVQRTPDVPERVTAGSPTTVVDLAEVEEALLAQRTALERIEARLEALTTRAGREPGRQSVESELEPPPSDADLAAIRASIDELRELILRQAAELARRADPLKEAERLQEAMESRTDADWVALEQLLMLYRADPAAARMDVQLLTYTKVVERFGRPHLTWSNDHEFIWVYGRHLLPSGDGYRLQLRFHFQGGVVTEFYVDEA